MTRKTGILGGTFDPIHNGHLGLAEEAGKLCDLDEIILLPAAVPPHKQAAVSDFSDRVAMLEIGLAKQPSFHFSTIEQLLPAPSYTIDTLRYLQLHSAHPVEFFFITGADTFLDIVTWKEYQELLRITHFIVFSRKGCDNQELYRLFKQFGYQKKNSGWYCAASNKWIYSSPFVPPSISSSEIRRRVAKGLSISELVPKGISEYIAAHGIYRESKSFPIAGRG